MRHPSAQTNVNITTREIEPKVSSLNDEHIHRGLSIGGGCFFFAGVEK